MTDVLILQLDSVDDGCAVSQKDTDQDGIYDNQDNCVEVPNENQIDTDNDGIGNS